MAKPDYAKARALAKQFLECIGDEEEGENPSLPKPDNDYDGAGEEANTKFLKSTEQAKESVQGGGSEGELDPEKKKKQMAMFSATLASKYGK